MLGTKRTVFCHKLPRRPLFENNVVGFQKAVYFIVWQDEMVRDKDIARNGGNLRRAKNGSRFVWVKQIYKGAEKGTRQKNKETRGFEAAGKP